MTSRRKKGWIACIVLQHGRKIRASYLHHHRPRYIASLRFARFAYRQSLQCSWLMVFWVLVARESATTAACLHQCALGTPTTHSGFFAWCAHTSTCISRSNLAFDHSHHENSNHCTSASNSCFRVRHALLGPSRFLNTYGCRSKPFNQERVRL